MTLTYTQWQHIQTQHQWLSLLKNLQVQENLHCLDVITSIVETWPDNIKVINLVLPDSPFINDIDYVSTDVLRKPTPALQLAKTLRVTSVVIDHILTTPKSININHINRLEYICVDDGTALIRLMASQRLKQLNGLKLVDMDEDALINLTRASLLNSVSYLEIQDASFDEDSLDNLKAQKHPLDTLKNLKLSQIEPMGRFLDAFLAGGAPQLNLLDINQDVFDTGDFQWLNILCTQNKRLRHLSWRVSPHCTIYEHDIETISQALRSLNLHNLTLIGVLEGHAPKLCQRVLTSITQSPFTDQLQHLSLASNGLRDSAIPVEGLLNHFPNLIHIDISDNQFGPKFIDDLCAAQLTLQGLKLSHYNLGPYEVRALATYGGLKRLLELDLKCTSLRDEDIQFIFSSNEHFELQYLDLTGNNLTIALNSFWQEQRSLNHLKVIHLSNNRLDATSISAILLSPNLTNVNTISLNVNNLNENDGCQLLTIPELGKLVELSLSGNSISQETLRKINAMLNKKR